MPVKLPTGFLYRECVIDRRVILYVRKKGKACSTTTTVSIRPTLRRSCGARKTRNTRQSRYDTGPSSIFEPTKDEEFPGICCRTEMSGLEEISSFGNQPGTDQTLSRSQRKVGCQITESSSQDGLS